MAKTAISRTRIIKMANENLGLGDLLLTETTIIKRDEKGNVVGQEVQRSKVQNGRQQTVKEDTDNISIA